MNNMSIRWKTVTDEKDDHKAACPEKKKKRTQLDVTWRRPHRHITEKQGCEASKIHQSRIALTEKRLGQFSGSRRNKK